MGAEGERTLVFTYGTLKRGFSNHGLMQELMRSGDASFVCAARTSGPLPLVCGPYRVPFLLNLPGSGQRVRGELYAVSARALNRMDELEGTRRGHYERLPLSVVRCPSGGPDGANKKTDGDHDGDGDGDGDGDEIAMEVEAYYAHRSYTGELWRRAAEKGFEAYSEREARGYVKRKDRPQDITFLDQIRIFVASHN